MRQIKNTAIAIVAVVGMFFGTQAIKRYQASDTRAELKHLAGSGFQAVVATKNQDCVSVDNQPDTACTPGMVRSDVVRGDVCKRGYSSTTKTATASTKERVFRAYNIPDDARKEYVIDYLVSINLGGSSDVGNLWPQTKSSTASKNTVESFLLNEVCAGRITLNEAQELVRRHWITIASRN